MLNVQVIDHYVTDNQDSYDKQFFVLKVQAFDTVYTVDRNYVDFVELNRRLSKTFYGIASKIPKLPLYDAAFIEGVLNNLAEGSLTNSESNIAFKGIKNLQDSIVYNSPFLKKLIDSKSACNPFLIKEGTTLGLYIHYIHYTPLYTTVHPYTPLYTAIHPYTPIYTPIHPYAPQYTPIHHYTPQYTSIHH